MIEYSTPPALIVALVFNFCAYMIATLVFVFETKRDSQSPSLTFFWFSFLNLLRIIWTLKFYIRRLIDYRNYIQIIFLQGFKGITKQFSLAIASVVLILAEFILLVCSTRRFPRNFYELNDEKDEKILKHLLVDARQSARHLAHQLNVSTVTMISRIKKLEAKKIKLTQV